MPTVREQLDGHVLHARVDHPKIAQDADTQFREENIFLFLPNLIGYLRIALAAVSLYFMPLHPRRCSALYSLSCLLDALDGMIARRYDQSTRFGAVLDMVTDRCTTTCLLVFLSTAKPAYSMVFQSLISLDLASHYVHMYATLAMGRSGQSHKDVAENTDWLMRLYYTNKTVLFVCCAFNELFFIALYLICFSEPKITPQIATPGKDSVAATYLESALLSLSPFSAAGMELARANKMDSTVPKALAYISLPVMLVKQYINVIQLISSCRWLADGDKRARREKRLAELKENRAR